MSQGKCITEGQFVVDVALLTATHEAAEGAINSYQSVARSFGLTVSIHRTNYKLMATGLKKTGFQYK